MFGSAILDIAIGLVFVYLVLSLVVTAANEVIASRLRWRAQNLYEGMRELLRDPKDKQSWADKLYGHPLVNALSSGTDRPSYVPSRTFALALLDLIAPAKTDGVRSLESIREGIAKLPPELGRTVTVLFDEAEHDIEKLKTSIEVWFNTSMERVSGWYKRKSQAVMLALAVVVTVAFNVDTLSLVRTLSNDAAVRAALVAKAQETAKLPITNASQPLTSAEADKALAESISKVESLGLPIGWHRADLASVTHPCLVWLSRVCGWILTIFAVSLGAPFWFDLLNKFMNIRGAGKAPEEEAKKPKEIPPPAGPGPAPGT